jgi:hypothetical protein
MKANKKALDEKKIRSLFNKFSFPMVKSCITAEQKEKAIGLSKILWLYLVSGADSEENIYRALDEVLDNHDSNVAVGSLYSYKMKPTLTTKEQSRLQKHYSDQKNFATLGNWM